MGCRIADRSYARVLEGSKPKIDPLLPSAPRRRGGDLQKLLVASALERRDGIIELKQTRKVVLFYYDGGMNWVHSCSPIQLSLDLHDLRMASHRAYSRKMARSIGRVSACYDER